MTAATTSDLTDEQILNLWDRHQDQADKEWAATHDATRTDLSEEIAGVERIAILAFARHLLAGV